jgi:hypothetical protein
LQVAVTLNRIAAIRPPPSLPQNSQFFRVTATGRSARSTAFRFRNEGRIWEVLPGASAP